MRNFKRQQPASPKPNRLWLDDHSRGTKHFELSITAEFQTRF
jgi:hypothetical protein